LYFSSHPLAEAFLVSFTFGLVAWFFGAVSASGLIGGGVIGGLIYYLTGWSGFVVLGAFFILGSVLTRVGYRHKKALGAAQEAGGRRGARHALANCAVGMVLAIVYKLSGSHPVVGAAFVASFATATADTAGTEAGSLWGKTAVVLTNFKRVPPGTPGAVSLEGTLASVAGACLIALTGWLVGLVLWPGLGLVAAFSGFSAAMLESLLGSFPRVEQTLGNEGMNLLNTFSGALLCLILAGLIL